MTADSLIGQTVAERYRVDALLGAGGMGAVYRARQLQLDHDVAIKLLSADRVGDEDSLERFRREAKHASKLDHPNLVPVTDFGQLEDGRPYLVMPLIEGRELGKGQGALLDAAEAVDIAAQVLDGLAFAHALGLVHRDLKPENVLLQSMPDGSQRVRLLDFGIALNAGAGEGEGRLTKGNLVFGTPAYMSPEQAGGGAVDGRSDQYALGVMLHEMLAGELPFVSDSPADVLRMHLVEPPPELSHELPAALRGVVARMLGKSRRERYSDAAAAAEALRASLLPGASASDETVATQGASSSSMAVAPTVAVDAQQGSGARWGVFAALALGGLGLVWALSGPSEVEDPGTPLPDLEQGADALPEPPPIEAASKKKPRRKKKAAKAKKTAPAPDDGRELPTLDDPPEPVPAEDEQAATDDLPTVAEDAVPAADAPVEAPEPATEGAQAN